MKRDLRARVQDQVHPGWRVCAIRLKAGLQTLGVGMLALVAGCRLWEPPKYERLTFEAGAKQVRVLMIGNSLTYYNDLPGLVQQLSAREAAPVYVEKVTSPYASLKTHWGWGTAVAKIREGAPGGPWDVVVLQEFSRLPVTDVDESVEYFKKFAEEAHKVGAKVIVTENWTRRGKDDEYDALRAAYARVRQETGATVAPVGTAWRLCEEQRPEVKLLVDDRHPSDAGTYLAAAVLYDVLYGKKSGALPAGLKGPGIGAGEEEALKGIADEAVWGMPEVKRQKVKG